MEESTVNYWGFIVGILGLFLAIYSLVVQIRSNKKKEPIYFIKSRNLIRDSITQYENLSVLYSNKKVDSFTVSKILFYNRGSDVINRDDIVISDQLRITSKQSVKILGAKVLQTTKSANQFRANLRKSRNCVSIDFEYLAKNEGAVIEVMHTGVSSADLIIAGVIKDVQEIKHIVISRKSFDFWGNLLFEGKLKFLFPLGSASALFFVFSVSIWQVFSIDTLNAYRHSIGLTREVSVTGGVANLIGALLLSLFGVTFFVPFYRSRMKAAPHGLELYDAE